MRHAVQGVEGTASVRCVKEEGVDVVILDVGGEGYAPKFAVGASPPLENGSLADLDSCSAAVIHVDVLAVVDGDVPSVGEISGAEEGRAAQGRDHVDGAGGRAEGMLEEAFLCCGGGGSVGDMKYFR